jgi:hypothetical protein
MLTYGFFDVPDPDNFGAHALLCIQQQKDIPFILTGRAVNMTAVEPVPLYCWNIGDSRAILPVSAQRLKNFFKHFGYYAVSIYDGGVSSLAAVDHHKHMRDYYEFDGNLHDIVRAIRYPEIEPLSLVITEILTKKESVRCVVGGPFTGLKDLIYKGYHRKKQSDGTVVVESVAQYIQEVYFMGPSCPALVTKLLEGNVTFDGTMELIPGRSPASNFNILGDPEAFWYCVQALRHAKWKACPTQVTKVPGLRIQNPEHLRSLLPKNMGCDALAVMEDTWYPRVLQNLGEPIYLHDLAPVIAVDPVAAEEIYEWVPITIDYVPHLPHEILRYGEVDVSLVKESNIKMAFRVKSAEKYFEYLYTMFSKAN